MTKFLSFYLLSFLAFNLQAQRDVIYKNLENALNNKDHVYHLDLSRKKLTTFPLEILKLRHLEKINLSKNRLTDLPPQISNLKNVEVINLSKNNFTSFPLALTTLKSIEEIILKILKPCSQLLKFTSKMEYIIKIMLIEQFRI